MGKQLALVDRTPGLTRDRREGISKDHMPLQVLAQLFDIPIRIVDTAGFEETVN
jgi:predicted GTPase